MHRHQATRLNKFSPASGMAWVPTLMLAALACAAFLVVLPADAEPAAPTASAAATARYQQDRAACMTGQSNQDRSTCLKEAGAAYAEAKRGGLKVSGETGGADARAANATQRCINLPIDQSKDCMSRMQGAGKVSGTAASGGILRELVTVETAASAAVK